MMTRCALLTSVALVSLNAGCCNEALWPVGTSRGAPLPHSMKGYELYSWKEGDRWHYTLIVGTNRIKTFDEIVSPNSVASQDEVTRILVDGEAAIKSALSQLPKGEEVLWQDGHLLDPPPAGTEPLAFPPNEIIADIKVYCEQLGLVLHVNR